MGNLSTWLPYIVDVNISTGLKLESWLFLDRSHHHRPACNIKNYYNIRKTLTVLVHKFWKPHLRPEQWCRQWRACWVASSCSQPLAHLSIMMRMRLVFVLGLPLTISIGHRPFFLQWPCGTLNPEPETTIHVLDTEKKIIMAACSWPGCRYFETSVFFSVKINISTTKGFRVGFFQPDISHPLY